MKGDTSSMKSLLVVPSTSSNLLILNENYQNNKDIDNNNNNNNNTGVNTLTSTTNTNTTTTTTTTITSTTNNTINKNLTYLHSNSNSFYDFTNINNNSTDNNNNNNNNNNTINSINLNNNNNNNNNNNSLSNSDFQKLKRSHAIQDIQAMDDYSPVTYETSMNTNNDCILEEEKFVLQGIKIRAAKLQKLLYILIESFDRNGKVLPETDFPRVFFLMHKWFMESDILGNMLVDLYEKYEKETFSDCTKTVLKQSALDCQLKICHAMQYWINTFPFHFALDSRLIEVIHLFTDLIQTKGHQEHLNFIDMSNIDSYDWMRKFTTRNPLRSKQHIPLAFNKIEPDVLANQLTYLEWKTLRRISFSDYKSYAIKGSIQDNPPLERSIQLFNGLSQWIQCMVLSKTTPKQRADVIHKFIEVAKHLRQLQNFNSLMAVIGGICHSALARLSKTNVYLSAEDQKVLNDFMELLSSSYNYAQYRKAISEINTFWIPIIGIHLKDMISLHTAHLDKLDNDLINFRKMAQLSVIFQNLTDLQNSIPPVQENRDLIKLLQLSLDMSYSEDEIYELSLAREPRTSVSSPSTPTKFSAFADWAKSVSTPPDPQTIQKHVNAMVDAVFKNYDHDRDGFISHAEFEEIAQNFPFVDAFAVLDADQDGMISKNEMKNYFLRANYHALKSEFKHDFHEITYMKPTFCTHCEGFLWGLIKQGWKCKDCGINAHKHCKDRVVMECRPKRNIGITRQISNSGTDAARKRSSFHKRSGVNKQVSTQTEPYEDLFLSDDSASSNEDNCTRMNTILNSNIKSINDDTNTTYGSFETNNTSIINESLDQCSNNNNNNTSLQRNNRQRRYKKFSKRRKSLPSQGSSNEEPHPVTLIPRGPLICSNNENNWLPDRFNGSINSSIFTQNSLSGDYDTLSNHSNNNILQKINNNQNTNNKTSTNINNNNNNNNKNNSLRSDSNSNSNLSITPSTSTYPDSINKPLSLSFDNATLTSPINRAINKNKNKITFRSPIPSTVNYDVNIIKTTVYNTSNSHSLSQSNTNNNNNNNKNNCVKYNSRIESDFYLNDYIDDYQLDDEVIEAGTYSSNDDDATNASNTNTNNSNSDLMIIKLKHAEEERKKLATEYARIKQQLETANAQINSLKNEMSSIRKDTINFLLDQMDSLHFTNKTSDV